MTFFHYLKKKIKSMLEEITFKNLIGVPNKIKYTKSNAKTLSKVSNKTTIHLGR